MGTSGEDIAFNVLSRCSQSFLLPSLRSITIQFDWRVLQSTFGDLYSEPPSANGFSKYTQIWNIHDFKSTGPNNEWRKLSIIPYTCCVMLSLRLRLRAFREISSNSLVNTNFIRVDRELQRETVSNFKQYALNNSGSNMIFKTFLLQPVT